MDILGHSVVAKIHVVIDENSCERLLKDAVFI
jgi:hypothetical protein